MNITVITPVFPPSVLIGRRIFLTSLGEADEIIADFAHSRYSGKSYFMIPSQTGCVTLGLTFLIFNPVSPPLRSVGQTGLDWGCQGWLPVGSDFTVPPSGHPGHCGAGLGSGTGAKGGPDLCDHARAPGPFHRGAESAWSRGKVPNSGLQSWTYLRIAG